MLSAEKTEEPRALLCWTSALVVLCSLFFFLSGRPLASAAATPLPDEPPADAVGSIEGEAIALQGPMIVQVENGEVKTILRSGSEVRVKSGQARINLVEGGQIVICGPAHISILKAGKALTVALDSGTIHARLDSELLLTVYTAQIQAQPIAIAGGKQEVLVGFDTPGVMCVRATSGAMRLEQQLTGQSVVVPQGGDILLADGALSGFRPASGHCTCEFQIAKIPPPPTTPEASVIASAKEIKPKPMESKRVVVTPPAVAAAQEPVYQVFMPPLRYDATAKVQDQPDPQLIVLVRRVRVRPTLIFEGEVAGDPVVAAVVPSPSAPSVPGNDGGKAAAKASPTAPNASVVDRVRSFFRRLWSGSS